MTNRASASARALAATALVGGFLVLFIIIGSSLGGGGESQPGGALPAQGKRKQSGGTREAPTAYVVQNGDTLTSIAHRTGVSVARIQELNPDVDPQILISGEKLRLR